MRRYGERFPSLARFAAVLALLGVGAGVPAHGQERVARVTLVDALPPSPSVDARLETIRVRIQRALVYPPNARARELVGTSRVEFEIDGSGQATGLETVASSGHWVLDRAARRAVEAASPLPYVWGRLAVPVRFELD